MFLAKKASVSGNQYVTYSYDNLNRLTNGSSSAGFSETNISYDAIGNIQGLNRNNYGSLSYNYNGNQLTTVSGYSSRNYGYDTNGNAMSDGQGNMISYNFLNLPANIPNKALNYTFDATGEKLSKQSNNVTTAYIDGIQYTNDNIDFVQTEEGRAINSGGTYKYEYTLTDHLGNNRVTFDQTNGKVGEDDYYPFGLNVHRQQNAGNKYLYNGKELQEELGVYDYGWRQYDPIIGRFTTIDPKAELSRGFSPFAYGDDNAIRNIDPDGMETEDANDEGGDGDQKGIIRNASEGFKLQHPVRAAIVDGIHGILEGFGINAIDDGIADMSSAKTVTTKDRVGLGLAVIGAMLNGPGEEGEEVGLHKNSNLYEGHQGVYEIKIDGETHKFGKADMTNTNKKTGEPTRLQSQINKLQKNNPNAEIEGKVIHSDKKISTKDIKAVETEKIKQHVKDKGQYPPGNQNHPGVN